MVRTGVGTISHLIDIHIKRAGGNLVQQGFPNVSRVPVNQCDRSPAIFPKLAPELGCQFQPTGAAADDNNAGYCHNF
jgi:hypothetical protein